jgi:hypothetical protein
MLLDGQARFGPMGEHAKPGEAKLLTNGVPPRDVAKNLGVSVPTLYRWIPASSHP